MIRRKAIPVRCVSRVIRSSLLISLLRTTTAAAAASLHQPTADATCAVIAAEVPLPARDSETRNGGGGDSNSGWHWRGPPVSLRPSELGTRTGEK